MESDEIVRMENTYTTQQLAEILDIGRSTLNKYSRSMEEAEYTFIKGENDKRAYTEHDIKALRQLQAYLSRNMAYDSAIKSVSMQFRRVGNVQIAMPAMHGNEGDSFAIERYEALEAKVDDLIEMNRALLARLDERDNAIRQLTEIVTAQKAIAAGADHEREQREQERDEKLTQVLREIQEAKAAAGKKPWWKRMRGN